MSEQIISKLLRVDSRGQESGAMTRFLGDQIEARLQAENPGLVTQRRQLTADIPLVDDAWIEANLTPADQRTAEQARRLNVSDQLIAELQDSDGLLITVPMHNFSIPGVFKAWIDQVCRAGLTFSYTADGPKGLLADRPTYVAIATGGVPLGSPVDYLSDYILQVLGFIGLTQVHLIAAEQVNLDSAAATDTAIAQLNEVLPHSGREAIA